MSKKRFLMTVCAVVVILTSIPKLSTFAIELDVSNSSTYSTCINHQLDLQYIGQETIDYYYHPFNDIDFIDHKEVQVVKICRVDLYYGGYYYRCIICNEAMNYHQKLMAEVHTHVLCYDN
jgi:hypothetical protein